VAQRSGANSSEAVPTKAVRHESDPRRGRTAERPDVTRRPGRVQSLQPEEVEGEVSLSSLCSPV